jgi:hypothetical protein
MRLSVPNLHDESLRAVIDNLGRLVFSGQKQLCDDNLCTLVAF